MKRTVRNLFISGAALLAIGVAVFVIGMTAIKWDFARLDAADYTERVFRAEESANVIDAVHIDVNTFGVIIKSGDSVSLEYYEASDSEVSVSIADGTLKVYEKGTRGGWFTHGIFNLGRIDKRFVLTVPSGLPIGINGTSAEIDMSGIVTEIIDADCNNLSLSLSDCEISNLMLNSGNLHITVDGCTFDAVDLDSTNLTVRVTDAECDSLKIHSTNVTANVKDSHIDGVTVTGTNVNVVLENDTCNSVFVNGVNTHCKLNAIIVNKLALDGTNLNAVVKIKGAKSEYTVISDGERVDGTDPDKLLTFDGTNLNVELDFI